jgi:ABC-type antimicrobial peptide transport system permease subunit
VIGLVEDVRQWGAETETRPEIYVPCEAESTSISFLIVRTATDANLLVPAIRNELATLDPDVSLAEVRTMKVVLESSTSDRRMSTALINLFISVTLLLAASGIYGTLSYELLQRRREIGVRIAVGALSRNIFRFVVSRSVVWLCGGVIAGIALTAALSFVLRSLVYDVSPLDPVSLLIGLGLVMVVASLAFAVPTWRATKVDPMEALRCE